MSEFTKTAEDRPHVNTVVLHRVRILFQVYPGINGLSEHRGIPGVEYTGRVGKNTSYFFGVTDEYGAVNFMMPAGETAKLEIFNTEFTVKLKATLKDVETREGAQERLHILGYYTGEINGNMDEVSDYAILNFQADSHLHAQGWAGSLRNGTNDKLKKLIGE